MRAESAVEPTKSENITVTWRRSARVLGRGAWGTGAVAASADGALALASLRSAAMASRSLRRCPRAATPSSFRFSAVRLGRTVSSISFSRNAASYCPEAKAPQPDHDVHDGARAPPCSVSFSDQPRDGQGDAGLRGVAFSRWGSLTTQSLANYNPKYGQGPGPLASVSALRSSQGLCVVRRRLPSGE